MKISLKITSALLTMALVGIFAFDRTPRGEECRTSTSPDGIYLADLCLLDWVPGGDSRYVGRVYFAQTGRVMAQHTFSTPTPEISWNSYNDVYVSFSKGDGGDSSVYISLPPTLLDRMLAARPHL
jgi:hypothetical protein